MEEGVDDGSEGFVGGADDVFGIGDGIEEEEEDEIARGRSETELMESRGLTGRFDGDGDGDGEEGRARGTPAWEQYCWAVFMVAGGRRRRGLVCGPFLKRWVVVAYSLDQLRCIQ